MAPGSLISMIGNSAAPALGQAASVSRVDHVIAFLSHRGRQMFVPNDVVQPLHGCLLRRRASFGRAQPHRLAARRVAGAAVQFAQGFQDGIDADGCLQPFRRPQRRA
jgi:hypothetical protein